MSSKYHLVPFSLGTTQVAKLKRGMKNGESVKVRLSHGSIGTGHHKLALTDSQLKKVSSKKRSGLGAELTLSHQALKHTAKHGSGFFTNLLGSAVSGLGDFVGNKIKGSGVRRPKRGKGFFQDLAGSAVSGLGNYIGSKIKGGGVRRKRVVRKRGKGFFQDLAGSAVSGLGNYIGNKIKGNGFSSNMMMLNPSAHNYADMARLAALRATGGGIYAPGMHGGSFMNTGY